MISLIGFSIGKTLVGILFVTLSLLVLYIAYKKLLQYLGRGIPVADDYCVLYPVEINPVQGELEIYFTTTKSRTVSIELLDNNLSLHTKIVENKEFGEGGHIVRFDTQTISNGTYCYTLVTSNQKTIKKIEIQNK
jgi:hypothetical protein